MVFENNEMRMEYYMCMMLSLTRIGECIFNVFRVSAQNPHP